jgi:hypothetical protein
MSTVASQLYSIRINPSSKLFRNLYTDGDDLIIECDYLIQK